MLDNQSELFIVVNEHDKIIGYRTRYECHHDKTLIHRTAGTLVFNDKKFLLQKRSLKKDMLPGRWGISAAGHVGKGETYEETARREMKEEIGVKALHLTFVKTFLVRGSRESEMTTLFFCQYSDSFTVDPDEVSEVRFFTKRELKNEMANGTIQLTDCAMETMKQIHFL